MGRIYLIRHGQTDSNFGKSFQGRINNPLNAQGFAQAEKMAEYMSQFKIDAIYSSSMLRACQTAEALAKKVGLEYKPMDLLQEISFGEWEGVSFSYLWENFPKEMGLFMEKPGDFVPPKGESMAEAAERCRLALKKILEEQGHDKNIAIVSHGGIIRVQLCELVGAPLNSLWKFSIHNVSVSSITNWEGNMVAETINDFHFLEEPMAEKNSIV